MRSLAWEHFTSLSPKEAECNICSKIVKVAGGTSNLRAHLKNKHFSMFALLNKDFKASKSARYRGVLADLTEFIDSGSEVEPGIIQPKRPGNTEPSTNKGTPKKLIKTEPKREKGVSVTRSFRGIPRVKGLAWKHFTSISFKEAKCNICLKIIRVAGGTSNLRAHMKKWHESVFAQMEMESKSGKPAAAPPAGSLPAGYKVVIPDFNFIEVGSEEVVHDPEDPEPKGSEVKTDPLPSPRKVGVELDAAITDALLYMVCKDGLPLDATENKGLKYLLMTAAPSYEVPGRKKSTKLLEEKHKYLMGVAKRQLAEAEWVSITTDLVSGTNKSHFVVTGHYIDNECFRNVCLGVLELTPGHTSDHIADNLSCFLSLWNLETSKICSITTDDRPNSITAIRKLMGNDRSHIPCLAHILNQCVSKALSHSEMATAVIEKVKLIMTYFRGNISISDALRAARSQNGVSEEAVQAGVTTWNSTYYLLERFGQVIGCVTKLLLSDNSKIAPLMLTKEELDVVTDLVTVLRPFEEATRVVSYHKHIIASMVLPILNCLREAVLNSSVPVASDAAITLKDALLAEVNNWFIPLEDNHILASATVLDPRFKMIHFRSPVKSSSILQLMSSELQGFTHGDSPSASHMDTEDIVWDVDDSLWVFHDQMVERQSTAPVKLPVESCTELHPELKQYLDLPTADRVECPLKLWQELKDTLPALAQLACKYLTVMGSAVASKHVVSRFNTDATDTKNKLSLAHINMLLFMGSLEHDTWFGE